VGKKLIRSLKYSLHCINRHAPHIVHLTGGAATAIGLSSTCHKLWILITRTPNHTATTVLAMMDSCATTDIDLCTNTKPHLLLNVADSGCRMLVNMVRYSLQDPTWNNWGALQSCTHR
jgi:hypothetical protein